MAASSSESDRARKRSALSYTQEIPLLEQLLSSGQHPDFGPGSGVTSLRRSTLGGVDERLQALLDVAIENQQTERIDKIIELQESFDALRRRLERSSGRTLSPDDIDLFRPLDLLAESSSAAAAASSNQGGDDDDDNDDEDEYGRFTWQAPFADADDNNDGDEAAAVAEIDDDCSVCWEPMGKRSRSLAGCTAGHRFCSDCYERQFAVLISEAELSAPLGCLNKACKATASDAEIRAIVGEEMFLRYLRFSVLAVVRSDPRTRWCPNIRCEQHVTVGEADSAAGHVQCPACRTAFCPECSMRPHAGRPCRRHVSETEKELGKWLANLGMRKAKRCPGCRELVEKNSGCNHMTCRCSAHFCWLCGWKWDDNHKTTEHFTHGDSLCLGLHFSSHDSLREARDAQLAGAGSYKLFRQQHGIETPKQRRLRIAKSGYGPPNPHVVELSARVDEDDGLFGLFD